MHIKLEFNLFGSKRESSKNDHIGIEHMSMWLYVTTTLTASIAALKYKLEKPKEHPMFIAFLAMIPVILAAIITGMINIHIAKISHPATPKQVEKQIIKTPVINRESRNINRFKNNQSIESTEISPLEYKLKIDATLDGHNARNVEALHIYINAIHSYILENQRINNDNSLSDKEKLDAITKHREKVIELIIFLNKPQRTRSPEWNDLIDPVISVKQDYLIEPSILQNLVVEQRISEADLNQLKSFVFNTEKNDPFGSNGSIGSTSPFDVHGYDSDAFSDQGYYLISRTSPFDYQDKATQPISGLEQCGTHIGSNREQWKNLISRASPFDYQDKATQPISGLEQCGTHVVEKRGDHVSGSEEWGDAISRTSPFDYPNKSTLPVSEFEQRGTYVSGRDQLITHRGALTVISETIRNIPMILTIYLIIFVGMYFTMPRRKRRNKGFTLAA